MTNNKSKHRDTETSPAETEDARAESGAATAKTKRKASKRSRKQGSNKKSNSTEVAASAPSPAESHKDITQHGEPVSRVEAFWQLAQRRARGEPVFLPSYQTGNDRRLHVRQTLREDHQTRIYRQPEDAGKKFEKLADSVFSFFRGTALLFYRDMAGADAWSPSVLALGDVHPENFGVMPSADNAPFFGVNDFDEAFFAPFTWDIKRGAVGFMLAAEEEGHKPTRSLKFVRRFVRGYIDGLKEYAQGSREHVHQLRLDNSPPIIKDILEDAFTEREQFLSKYLDEKHETFRPREDLIPRASRHKEFEEILSNYRKENQPQDRGRAGSWRLKSVAEKRDSGTASLGLARYYLLIEGPHQDGTDDVILEMKQARRSALDGLAPPSQHSHGGQAARIVTAHAVHLVGGDPFYGKAEINGEPYMVREKSPYKNEADLGSLKKKEWKQYAFFCGRVLAQAHARSDWDAEPDEPEVEKRILTSIADEGLFVHDVLCFAKEAVERVHRDHEHFKREHALGAFQFTDRRWA